MKRGLVRWNVFTILAFVGLCLLAYRYSFFDRHLKLALEKRWSQLNGSEVNIGLLKSNALAGVIDMRDIEISNTAAREWNRLELGRLHLTLSWPALIRGKVFIEDAILSEVKANTKRKFVATTFPPLAIPMEMTKSSPANPLQEAAEFFQRTEGSVDSQVSTPSVQITRAMDNEVGGFLRSWQNRLTATPTSAALIQQLSLKNASPAEWQGAVQSSLKNAKALREQLKTQNGQLLTRIQGVEDLAEQDMQVLKQRFQVPELDVQEIAHEIGTAEARRWIRFVERYYAGWQNFFEGKTYPRPPEFGRMQGTDFRFPLAGGQPSFWLRSLEINTQAGLGEGLVAGKITDLTSDPTLIDKATHISINGDFEGIKGLAVDATIDHRKENPDDRLQLTVASQPVHNRLISSSPLLTLAIYQAESSVNLEVTRQGNTIGAQLRSNFETVVYRVDSSSQSVKSLFENALAPVQSFQIDGEGKGTYPAMDWTYTSNLAEGLKNNLQETLSKESSEARSQLKDVLVARLREEKERLSAHLLEGLRPLRESAESLEQGLQKLADDVKAGRVPARGAGNPI